MRGILNRNRLATVAACAAVGVGGFAIGFFLPPRPDTVVAYLTHNPIFLVDHRELIDAARPLAVARVEAAARTSRRDLIKHQMDRGALGDLTPRWGSGVAPLGLVEFTDYACLPCKAMESSIEYAAASNPDRRIIIVYFPLDGAGEFAARAGLAAWAQDPNKFLRFHRALMRDRDSTSSDAVAAAARAAGLDLGSIESAMGDSSVRAHLEELKELAVRVGIRGVPSFITADGILATGPMATERLEHMVRSEPSALR